MRTVHNIMKHKGGGIFSIDPGDTVYDAIAMMAEKEVGALLVMRGGQPVGIISERDYTRKVILKDKSSKQTRVAEIMTSNVISATSRLHIDECVNLMKEHHIRHLPVMNDGRIVGVVSIGDVVKRKIDLAEREAKALKDYISST